MNEFFSEPTLTLRDLHIVFPLTSPDYTPTMQSFKSYLTWHKVDLNLTWHGWLVQKALASHQGDPGSILGHGHNVS